MRRFAPIRWTTVVLAISALALGGLSACGSTAKDASGGASASPVTQPAPVLDGTPLPSALSAFSCAAGDGGWTASGEVTNSSKASASFEVSVVVSTADNGIARTTRVEDVPSKGTAKFTLDEIQPSGDTPVCRVRVAKI